MHLGERSMLAQRIRVLTGVESRQFSFPSYCIVVTVVCDMARIASARPGRRECPCDMRTSMAMAKMSGR